jgi:hypothetical protein
MNIEALRRCCSGMPLDRTEKPWETRYSREAKRKGERGAKRPLYSGAFLCPYTYQNSGKTHAAGFSSESPG